MIIIEKFCAAQSERKSGVPNLSASGRRADLATSISNGVLRAPFNPKIPNLKAAQNPQILAEIRKWFRPFLIDSAPTEFVLTPRKKSPKILIDTRTHIRNFKFQLSSAYSHSAFPTQNLTLKTPITDLENRSFLPGLARAIFAKGSTRPRRFLPGATTTSGHLESAQKNLSEFVGKFGKNLRGR